MMRSLILAFALVPALVLAQTAAPSCAALTMPTGYTCAVSTQIVVTPPAVVDHSGHGPAVDMTKLIPGWAGVAVERVRPARGQPTPSDSGDFRTLCFRTHMLADDPIVFPGQPGASHLHTFFGNPTVTASSTDASLRAAPTSSCMGGILNKSAYWMPTMIDTKDGSPVQDDDALFYYKTGYNKIPKASFRAMPQGLRMVAGDAKSAVSQGRIVNYQCVRDGDPTMDGRQINGPVIQNCPVGAKLWVSVKFPQCWDGVNLDSPNHKSHMAYVDGATQLCPKTHPVPLPELELNARFTVREKDAPLRWRLSSDMYDPALPGGLSLHADVIEMWDVKTMDAWIKGCTQAGMDCGGQYLGDGRELY